MKPRRRPVSGVTALVVVVLLLVPALAWMQYRWVGQVSEGERDRMQRTLRTSALQFATAFDTELSRAVVGLQLEGTVMRDENWVSYAQRYTTWTERALDTRLVRDVLLVDAPAHDTRPAGSRRAPERDGRTRRSGRSSGEATPVAPDDLRLRRWNNALRTFEPVEWTEELTPMRPVLADHFGEVRMLRMQGSTRYRRESAVSFSVGDDYTLVSPVTLFEFPEERGSAPRIDVLGFTLVRIDPAFVTSTLLPSLTARHFHGDDGTADYRVAVTDRRDAAQVIWESEPGAAAAIGTTPDVEQPFMSPRPDQVFMIARNGDRSPVTGGGPDERIVISVLQDRRPADGGPPPPPGRGFSPFEGRWRVAATHRAGSLEAAVAVVRTRNLLLSSGILALLSLTIALIVVSARRAQTLARQQMEFVAAVSHELRTPVSVIGSAASNLADGVVADPVRVRKYGETIQGEARRLGDTVERVLQLAGIAAGSSAAARGPVGLPDVVRQAVAACRNEIDARGVALDMSIPEGLPAVYGDAAALRSAVQNLISNAVKYGGDARWVRVSATASPGLTRWRHARASSASQVAIAISDRGLGISPEDRRHIFEPFYRGREAVSRQIQGSGLGLNLVWRIAEAHGGHVDVTSEPGKGSTFTLVLPAAPSAPADVGLGLLPSGVDTR